MARSSMAGWRASRYRAIASSMPGSVSKITGVGVEALMAKSSMGSFGARPSGAEFRTKFMTVGHGRLHAAAADRNRRGRLAQAHGFGRTESFGQTGGQAADKGVAGADGVHG
eukprot:Opistho-2@61653